MKLTSSLSKKIAKAYNLGDIDEIKAIKGGNINYNFICKTKKTDFIIRILGYKLDNYWTNKKELEFNVLEFLIARKIPYAIPHFLKNLNGRYISNIEGKLIEVYPRIKGQKIIKLKSKHIIEIAKALAIYHKIIALYPIPTKFKKLNNHKWIKKELEDMKSTKPKNKLDKYMLDNVQQFVDLLNNKIK